MSANIHDAAAEAAMAAASAAASTAKISSLVTVGGGAISVGGYVANNDLATFIGATAAVVGMLVTWYYSRKRHNLDVERTEFERQENTRKQEMHVLEMQIKQKALEDCIEGKGPCE